jgi:hypothetical protein
VFLGILAGLDGIIPHISRLADEASDNPMAKRAFISHITEEAAVAAKLKAALARDFLQMLDVFVSSDGESISAGDDWLESINKALEQSSAMLILCSPSSIRRPWINFEAGAAWMRKIPLIPLCHAGLTPGDLPAPLSFRQGLLLTDPRGLRQLYVRIARELGCAAPSPSFAALAEALVKLVQSLQLSERDVDLLDRDRGIKRRLDEALRHDKYKWRSLQSVAAAAGLSEDVAADHLRADSKVVFGRGKSGTVIVGLKSRVP